MTMQLQENRYYRDGRGQKIGPMRKNLPSGLCWVATGNTKQAWYDDGRNYRYDTEPEFNLKEEWIDVFEKAAPTTKASLLDAAKEAVADRGLNYGKPEANFQRIARLWQAHLMNRYAPSGLASECLIPNIDAADVAQMMVLMKIARLENSPAHLDSWTDIAGYAACGAEITDGENSA